MAAGGDGASNYLKYKKEWGRMHWVNEWSGPEGLVGFLSWEIKTYS